MQTESVLQTKNRSGPAKNRFSVALICTHNVWNCIRQQTYYGHIYLSFICKQFTEINTGITEVLV